LRAAACSEPDNQEIDFIEPYKPRARYFQRAYEIGYEVRAMRRAHDCALLAAVAVAMIASAAAASPQDDGQSYLPPQSSRSQELTKSPEAAAKEPGRPQHRVRTKTRHRRAGEEFQAGPPDGYAFPGMLFFPFF